MEYISSFSCPLGTLLLRSDGSALTGLSLVSGAPEREDDLPLFDAVRAWLTRYFRGEDPGPVPVPLKPAGTPFQQQVWQLLSEIPYGTSRTYGELARALGEKMSPQAVGNAVGKNPIAILLPCHRVLGQGDRLTGYAYGLRAKAFLLALEQISFRKTP